MALAKTERRILQSVGQTMYPRGGAIDVDARDVGLVDYVEDYLDRLPYWDRIQLRAFFRLFDLGFAFTTTAPGRRFVDAHPDEQREYLDSWEHSPNYYKRMGWQGLRMVVTFAYAQSPDVKLGMGELAAEPEPGDVEQELKALAGLARKLS